MTARPDERDGPLDLPASMADIFLALVAVVILMLLTLLPAIRKPGELGSPQTADLSWHRVVIDGEKPAVYVAAGAFLQVGAGDVRVELDDILQNQALSNDLQTASQNRSILLVVEPDGQESAFLFASLMGSLGIGQFYQLRVEASCAHIRDSRLAGLCQHPIGGSAQ